MRGFVAARCVCSCHTVVNMPDCWGDLPVKSAKQLVIYISQNSSLTQTCNRDSVVNKHARLTGWLTVLLFGAEISVSSPPKIFIFII